MACINALRFCFSHSDCRDETFLVEELSKIRQPISKGLRYFDDSSPPSTTGLSSSTTVKESVQRSVQALSNHLNLSNEVTLELLIEFLAARNDNDDYGHFQAPMGHHTRITNNLFNRVRAFYRQERQALCALVQLALCDWHGSWCTISDVLFAMTQFDTRLDLINSLLSDYNHIHSKIDTLISNMKPGTTLNSGQQQDGRDEDGDGLLGCHLNEEIELLNAILIGVHSQSFTSNQAASEQFVRFLESFWSQSFGLRPLLIQMNSGYAHVLKHISLLQSLILIRSAQLDSLSLFTDKSHTDTFTGPGNGKRKAQSSSFRLNEANGPAQHQHHFLSDSNLLNRLLISLSDLGNSPIHGPLLLFGAVCARSFATSGSALDVDSFADKRHVHDSPSATVMISETAHLVAGEYGYLAIHALDVFNFLSLQLANLSQCAAGPDLDFLKPIQKQLNIVEFCAHVAVFDLLTLLTRDVVLWSLDSRDQMLEASNRKVPNIFGLPKRAAFVELFSRTLFIVARYSSIAVRLPPNNGRSEVDSTGPHMGRRLSGLVTSLTESFPYDLGILRLCSALMMTRDSPAKNTGTLTKRVSELICCMPYLTQPLNLDRLKQISHAYAPPSSCLPVGDFQPTNYIILTKPYYLLDNDAESSSGTEKTCFQMLLPVGTIGLLQTDLDLVTWKHNYSIWSVFRHELSTATEMLELLNQSSSHRLGSGISPKKSVSTYRQQLLCQLRRIHEFIRFGVVCIQARSHIHSCLSMVEYSWPLIMQCIEYDASCTPPDTSEDRLDQFLIGHLLPSVFDLLSGVLSDPDHHTSLRDYSIWKVVCQQSTMLFPRYTTKSYDHFTQSRQITKPCYLMPHLSVLTSPTVHTSQLDTSNHTITIRLLCSYVEFISALWSATKTLCATVSVDNSVEQYLFAVECAVHLVIHHLLPKLLKPVSWNRSSFSAYVIENDLPTLTQHCLILLTDLLMTRTAKDEMTNYRDGHASVPSTTNPIVSIQQSILNLILCNDAVLDTLINLTSIPLQTLLDRFESFCHGFTLSDSEWSTRSRATIGDCLSKAVWLALILIYHLIQQRQPNGDESRLLQALNRSESFRRHSYVATLFSYMNYPYNVGLVRMAISVLKGLVQFSSCSLVKNLGSRAASVRQTYMTHLSSSTSDILVRVNLYDLLSESILRPSYQSTSCSDLDQPTTKRLLPEELVRFLLTPIPKSLFGVNDPSWFGNDLSDASLMKESPENPIDLFQCCISVLSNAKPDKGGAFSNQTILLVRSVTKFIAALFLQEMYVFTGLLESKSNFWNTLVDRLIDLLNYADKPKTVLSDVEIEVCGHIASVVGLALFKSTSTYCASEEEPLHLALQRLIKCNCYSSWFKLVKNRLESTDRVLPATANQLDALYEATCRWKCMLLVHYRWIESNGTKTEFITDGKLVSDILDCLDHLLTLGSIHTNTDLAAQLAICLTGTLSHLSKLHSSITPLLDVSKPIEQQVIQLVGILVKSTPSESESFHHLHSDLLASLTLLMRVLSQVQPASTQQRLCQLKSDVIKCVLDCVAKMMVYTQMTQSSVMTIRQALVILSELWTDCVQRDLFRDQLVQSGLLNNILVTMDQFSKLREGCSLCHDIMVLVCRIAFPMTVPDRDVIVHQRLYPQLSEAMFSSDIDQSPTEPEVASLTNGNRSSVTSLGYLRPYSHILARSMVWPPIESLLQWIIEENEMDMLNHNSSGDSFTPGDDTCHSTKMSGNANWLQLVLLQLRFVCLVHDLLGGIQHPFVRDLMNVFFSDNSSHLHILSTNWCSALSSDASINPNYPPSACALIHNHCIPPGRLHLAQSIGALYWRMLISGQSAFLAPLIHGSGLPSLGLNILFRSTPSDNESLSQYTPTYFTPASSQFNQDVFGAMEYQLHIITILFQRTGYQSIVSRSTSLTRANTPVKSGRAKSSSLPPTGSNEPVDASHTTTCSGESELIVLTRHLVTCLSVILVQLPSLGYLSLLGSEELHQLRTPLQLSFNAPSLEDTYHILSFGLFITLAHSLGYVIGKVSAPLRAMQTGDCEFSAEHKDYKLLSLLVEANEMVLSILFSQATLALASSHISSVDKQRLVRELSGELNSSTVFGRSSRRTYGSRSSARHTSHSPSGSRSSSVTHTRSRLHESSPYVLPTQLSGDLAVVGTRFCGTDLNVFTFQQAVERFTELLQMNN